MISSPVLLLTWSASTALAQVHLVNITNPVNGLPSACIQVLNQAVTCDESIQWAGMDFRYESDETLTKLCTATCSNSLSTYLRRIAGACGTSRFEGTDGLSYLPGYFAEVVLERHQTLCLKNANGKFCNAEIRNALKIDPDTQKMTGDPGPEATCNTCVASMLSTQLQMQLAHNNLVTSSVFKSFTSSCRISNMSPTPPATSTTFVSVPTTSGGTPTPTCSGKVHAISSGENCRSISLKESISTNELLLANELEAWCNNFPTSGTVCIPEKKKCQPHQLNYNGSDSCASLASQYNVTWAQIVSWNIEVGTYCDKIRRLAANGFVICVSTPGGEWVNPHPELEPTPAPTSTVETYFTLTGTNFASAPRPTRQVAYPNAGYVTPFANNTSQDCEVYVEPPIWTNWTLLNSTYSCEAVASGYGVSMDDFLDWNPSLLNSIGPDGECELQMGAQYCSQKRRIQSNQLTEHCVKRNLAQPGFDCAGYVEWNSLDRESFIEWNPDVGVACESFQTGHTYCAAVRHFRPKGIISTCSRWAMANDTNPDNNPCGQFETKFGLSHARFVAWNPSVKNDCSGIKLYYDYCVGTPTFPGNGA